MPRLQRLSPENPDLEPGTLQWKLREIANVISVAVVLGAVITAILAVAGLGRF